MQVQQSSVVRDATATPVKGFVEDHLSALPDGLHWLEHFDESLLRKSTKKWPKGGEPEYYAPFAEFLTKLSAGLYGMCSFCYKLQLC